jgi:hypothetical protein
MMQHNILRRAIATLALSFSTLSFSTLSFSTLSFSTHSQTLAQTLPKKCEPLEIPYEYQPSLIRWTPMGQPQPLNLAIAELQQILALQPSPSRIGYMDMVFTHPVVGGEGWLSDRVNQAIQEGKLAQILPSLDQSAQWTQRLGSGFSLRKTLYLLHLAALNRRVNRPQVARDLFQQAQGSFNGIQDPIFQSQVLPLLAIEAFAQKQSTLGWERLGQTEQRIAQIPDRQDHHRSTPLRRLAIAAVESLDEKRSQAFLQPILQRYTRHSDTLWLGVLAGALQSKQMDRAVQAVPKIQDARTRLQALKAVVENEPDRQKRREILRSPQTWLESWMQGSGEGEILITELMDLQLQHGAAEDTIAWYETLSQRGWKRVDSQAIALANLAFAHSLTQQPEQAVTRLNEAKTLAMTVPQDNDRARVLQGLWKRAIAMKQLTWLHENSHNVPSQTSQFLIQSGLIQVATAYGQQAGFFPAANWIRQTENLATPQQEIGLLVELAIAAYNAGQNTAADQILQQAIADIQTWQASQIDTSSQTLAGAQAIAIATVISAYERIERPQRRAELLPRLKTAMQDPDSGLGDRLTYELMQWGTLEPARQAANYTTNVTQRQTRLGYVLERAIDRMEIPLANQIIEQIQDPTTRITSFMRLSQYYQGRDVPKTWKPATLKAIVTKTVTEIEQRKNISQGRRSLYLLNLANTYLDLGYLEEGKRVLARGYAIAKTVPGKETQLDGPYGADQSTFIPVEDDRGSLYETAALTYARVKDAIAARQVANQLQEKAYREAVLFAVNCRLRG